ncbi:MAG TPA: hypothetical protein PLM52_14495, partial [Tabrizicola sp.]|nr:hypothetical protein [Tabrizicola sp.]
MPTFVLFLLTCGLAVVSLVACQMLQRHRLGGAVCGVAFALALFLRLPPGGCASGAVRFGGRARALVLAGRRGCARLWGKFR